MTASATALSVLKPITVTSAMLTSSTVPENDYAAWSSATTYALAARVIVVSSHKVYESLQASNLNHDPLTSPLWWIEVSPTNRWKVFDTSNSTQTAQATSISYTLAPGGAITAFAALNLTGATSVRVRLIDATYGTVYDQTRSIAPLPPSSLWWSWFFGTRFGASQAIFTDLPAFPNASLTIDLAGTSALAVGVFLMGQVTAIGLGVNLGAALGIQDYSRKETNDFGDAVLIQRAFAKRASFDMLLEKSDVDNTISLLADLRAVPCLWIGSSAYESTTVFGFYKDFAVTISYPTYADCSLQLEGLT